MEKGDLVRCRVYDPFSDNGEFPFQGILIEYDKILKTAKVLMNHTGVVTIFRANDVQLMKRSPENIRKIREGNKK